MWTLHVHPVLVWLFFPASRATCAVLTTCVVGSLMTLNWSTSLKGSRSPKIGCIYSAITTLYACWCLDRKAGSTPKN